MAPPVGKVEARAVIRFLFLKGKNAKEIRDELVAVYGDNAPSYEAVKKWRRRFQCGQETLDDDPRSGRPSISEEPQIARQVEALVLEDRRITVKQIVQTVHICHGSVCNILHNELRTLANSLGYEILDHPPYSPDLAPSDFFLFSRLKAPLRGRRFQDDNEVIFEVEQFLNGQNADFYDTGLRQLIHRWEKCVAVDGAYVEKD